MRKYIKTSFNDFVNENYDLVSQFKGNHNGNEMEKNEFLNSLGLEEEEIKVLETWINLLRADQNWINAKFTDGVNFKNLIKYVSNEVGDLAAFIEKNKDENPQSVANRLK